MAKNSFDFSGYATKVDLKCSDGRVIRKDAFKHNDGQTVPLVWQHIHNDVNNVLGHALLQNREDGVYAFCTFNNTDAGKNAKELVKHGDIKSLSIYANQLQHKANDVIHGDIKEVSLVLAGANPGALIDNLSIQHGDGPYEIDETEAIIYTGEKLSLTEVEHSDKEVDPEADKTDKKVDTEVKHADQSTGSEKTVQEVLDTMTEEQRNVCYAMIAHALGDNGTDTQTTDNQNNDNNVKHSIEGGEQTMKKNIFDKNTENKETTLSHEDVAAVFADVKRYGSLKDSTIAHGITNIDYLFPDATSVDGTPQFIKREAGWVPKVMGGVHHTPFSRIKSTLADITSEDARAKGYIKGKEKIDEVFSLLKRTTTPTTIYKKQKHDRDDVVDITDFDVVAWLKAEMRMMLDEEIARAILVGDGRLSSSDDKINESNIRPIWKDDDLYAVKASFDAAAAMKAEDKAKAFIKTAIRARKNYKGSGDPTMYMTEDMLTECLLLEDSTGRVIYDSVAKLATTLRVKEIVTVPVMENLTRLAGSDTMTLHGIYVNLDDYNVGADKGGAVNMFDDFDIDFNAQKYLIETRASGALIKPFAAVVIESKAV
jgi:HK97 family phage prohead protease